VPATWCSGCSRCWGASSVLGSPISGARFWRIGPNADYDPLDRPSRHQDTIERIARHWEDILRIAGSPKLGIIGAAELVRSLLGYLLRKTVPESFSSHCGAHAGEILGSSVGCRRFVLDVRKLLVCCHSVSPAVSQLWVVYCHLATSNRSACQTSGFGHTRTFLDCSCRDSGRRTDIIPVFYFRPKSNRERRAMSLAVRYFLNCMLRAK